MARVKEKALLNIFSKLYLLLEEWIVFNNIRKDRIRSDIELVKHFNRSGEYKLANIKAKQAQSIIDNEPQISPEIDSFVKVKDHQVNMYHVQLEHWISIKNVNHDNVLKLKSNLNHTQTSDIHGMLSQLVIDGNESKLRACYEMIKSSKIKRADDFFVKYVMFLINYAQKLWFSQKLETTDLVVELFEFGLESEVLFNSGKLPFVRFMAIVNTIGVFKSLEWTDAFIMKWASRLDNSDTESNIELAKALNYFNHGRFNDTEVMLSKISTKVINSRALIHRYNGIL